MRSDEILRGTLLTVDLDAIVANWRKLAETAGVPAAGMVKAQAYGLGCQEVATALHRAGCRDFFVALPVEGVALRQHLGNDATIHVLSGPLPGSVRALIDNALTPVLNTPEDIATWTQAGGHPCDLHIDTGMTRLGLEAGVDTSNLDVDVLMSHLACADTPDHPLNALQREAFRAAKEATPCRRASLANSSGIFLGPDYAFDLVRPGAALYGVNPTPDADNPMAQVVTLQGKILQVRAIDTPRTVGYGATYEVSPATRIATVAIGYADGYFRCLGNVGTAYVGDHPAKVIGRVSMDLITLDVSQVPEHHCRVGQTAELLGRHYGIDDMARDAGTIGYEVLTALGPRHARVYVGGTA